MSAHYIQMEQSSSWSWYIHYVLKYKNPLIFFWLLTGNLMPGDQILEVNGDSLVGVTSER